VVVTDVRPTSGEYVMNMTGPLNYGDGSAGGVAFLDCGNRRPNDITFAFVGQNSPYDASGIASIVGQEVGHAFGLEHVDDERDMLYPSISPSSPDRAFLDTCLDVLPNPTYGYVCADQHVQSCGVESEQNSYAELLEFLGQAAPDVQPPTVEIVYPEDEDEFAVGDEFSIEVEATDDRLLESLELFSNGEMLERDSEPPFGWQVTEIPAGTYEFYVQATDVAGNVGKSATIVVHVGGAAPDDSGDDTGASSPIPDDDEDDTDTGAPDPGLGGSPVALPRGPQDCRCRAGDSDAGSSLAWALVGLATIGFRCRRSRP
jgi:MYXO-CTERM domain-containing protein